MHKDTQTGPATLTYTRLDGCRKKDRRFEERKDGEGQEKKREDLDGDGTRGQKEGEGQMEGRGGVRPGAGRGGKESEEQRFVFD